VKLRNGYDFRFRTPCVGIATIVLIMARVRFLQTGLAWGD
jgi:hypothetical protein